MGSLTSFAWTMAPSLVALVQSTGPRAGEPPPTSGNGMTLLLGLTASSLLVVVVGAWLLRSLRALLATLRRRRHRQGAGAPSWPEATGGVK
jgi:hypothetical protein